MGGSRSPIAAAMTAGPPLVGHARDWWNAAALAYFTRASRVDGLIVRLVAALCIFL
jgi:hypothetical protein